MTLTKEQKVAIKGDGTLERGKRIKQFLIDIDGRIDIDWSFDSVLYFYINSIGFIDWRPNIPDGYTLIELPDEAVEMEFGKVNEIPNKLGVNIPLKSGDEDEGVKDEVIKINVLTSEHEKEAMTDNAIQTASKILYATSLIVEAKNFIKGEVEFPDGSKWKLEFIRQ